MSPEPAVGALRAADLTERPCPRIARRTRSAAHDRHDRAYRCHRVAVRAVGLDAIRIQRERMIMQRESAFAGDAILAALDLRIVEFLHAPALKAYQMVVVRPLVELEHRLSGLEVMALQEPRLLELGQYAVDRRQPYLDFLGEQLAVYVLGAQVAHTRGLEQFEDAQPWSGGLQPDIAQVFGVLWRGRRGWRRILGRQG